MGFLYKYIISSYTYCMENLENLLFVGLAVLFVIILLGITLYNIDKCQKQAINEFGARRRNDLTTVHFTSVIPPAPAKFPRENTTSHLFVDITKPSRELHGHSHNNCEYQQKYIGTNHPFANKNSSSYRPYCTSQNVYNKNDESDKHNYKYMKTSYKYFQKGIKLTKEKANSITKKVLANGEASSSHTQHELHSQAPISPPYLTPEIQTTNKSIKKIPPPRPPPLYRL